MKRSLKMVQKWNKILEKLLEKRPRNKVKTARYYGPKVQQRCNALQTLKWIKNRKCKQFMFHFAKRMMQNYWLVKRLLLNLSRSRKKEKEENQKTSIIILQIHSSNQLPQNFLRGEFAVQCASFKIGLLSFKF